MRYEPLRLIQAVRVFLFCCCYFCFIFCVLFAVVRYRTISPIFFKFTGTDLFTHILRSCVTGIGTITLAPVPVKQPRRMCLRNHKNLQTIRYIITKHKKTKQTRVHISRDVLQQNPPCYTWMIWQRSVWHGWLVLAIKSFFWMLTRGVLWRSHHETSWVPYQENSWQLIQPLKSWGC